jgi:hypothetical protein
MACHEVVLHPPPSPFAGSAGACCGSWTRSASTEASCRPRTANRKRATSWAMPLSMSLECSCSRTLSSFPAAAPHPAGVVSEWMVPLRSPCLPDLSCSAAVWQGAGEAHCCCCRLHMGPYIVFSAELGCHSRSLLCRGSADKLCSQCPCFCLSASTSACRASAFSFHLCKAQI